IGASVVTGCLRFKGSDALLKREPRTHAQISTTGAPLGPDNLFHIKLDGPVREMRRLGQVCTAGAGAAPEGLGGIPARPNLTITPEPATATRPTIPPAQIPPPTPPPLTPQSPIVSPMVQGLMDAGTTDALQVPLPGPDGAL